MPEEISCDFENSLIRVDSIGTVPTSVWHESLKTVGELRKEHGFDRLLVDTRRQTKTSNYEDILEFLKTLPQDLKIALLLKDASDEPSSPTGKLRFAECAASHQGIQIKSFIKESTAISWLKSAQPSNGKSID